MTDNTKDTLTFAGLVLALIAVAWLLMLSHQRVDQRTDDSAATATTTCRPILGWARVWIDPSLDEYERARAEAHEAVHVRQIHEQGCLRLLVAGSAPLRLIEREAEAHCAEVPLMVEAGGTWDHAVLWAIDAIWEGYPLARRAGASERESMRQVERAVHLACGEMAIAS
jgi:hypothetical protein